jgi:hypothetical protein
MLPFATLVHTHRKIPIPSAIQTKYPVHVAMEKCLRLRIGDLPQDPKLEKIWKNITSTRFAITSVSLRSLNFFGSGGVARSLAELTSHFFEDAVPNQLERSPKVSVGPIQVDVRVSFQTKETTAPDAARVFVSQEGHDGMSEKIELYVREPTRIGTAVAKNQLLSGKPREAQYFSMLTAKNPQVTSRNELPFGLGGIAWFDRAGALISMHSISLGYNGVPHSMPLPSTWAHANGLLCSIDNHTANSAIAARLQWVDSGVEGGVDFEHGGLLMSFDTRSGVPWCFGVRINTNAQESVDSTAILADLVRCLRAAKPRDLRVQVRAVPTSAERQYFPCLADRGALYCPAFECALRCECFPVVKEMTRAKSPANRALRATDVHKSIPR